MNIKEIVLRYGYRGMPILQEHLPQDGFALAAQKVLAWKRGNVLLATGFYVAGYAETDGPVGTVVLAKALAGLGFNPIVVTDKYCQDFFELENLETVYVPLQAEEAYLQEILKKYEPVGLISIERCGRNEDHDYANMLGKSVAEFTAPIDKLFEMAFGKVETIGIGDGGNEIGMGNLQDVISANLTIKPCIVVADTLLVATVSNWGAYGLSAALSIAEKRDLLWSFAEIKEYMAQTVAMGSIDGVLKQHVVTADGFSLEIEEEIVECLHKEIQAACEVC